MRITIAAVGFVLFGSNLLAQETRGKILGRVTDSSGAVVAAIEVKATHTETNVTLSAIANTQGHYEILYVRPGIYTVSAELPGFKKFVAAAIQVRVDDEIALDIVLQPGLVTESITVTAATPLLETGTSLGQVVDNKRITELPLSGGNAYTLAQLTAGVIGFAAPNHPSLAPAVEVVSNFSVSGVRSSNTEFSIDGSPSMWGRNASFVPPAEMIGEFKVETSRFDAAGRSPGGSVNVAIRSGTNQLRGSFSEYHSDNKLQTIDFFQRRFLYNPATGPLDDQKRKSVNPQFVINRFGATIGGPVLLPKLYDGRNRTFWIYGFEGLTRPSQERGDYLHTVPTPAQRQGDFSALLSLGSQFQIYDPATTVPAATAGRYTRQPLAGNIIPASRINAVSRGLLKYWPEPNLPPTRTGEDNYWGVLPSYNEYFSHTTRVDHNIGNSHRLFGRYNQAHQLFDAGQTLPGIATGNHRNRYSKGAGLDDVWIVGPRFLVNLRYSFSRFIQTTSPYGLGFDLLGAGFSRTLVSQVEPEGVTFPRLSVGVYDQLGNSYPNGTFTNYHTWGADFTHSRGTHSIRFGVEHRVNRSHNKDFSFSTPQLNFSTNWTRGPFDNSAGAQIGQDLASFLFGLPTGGQAQVNASFAEQSRYTGVFVQDDYKVSPRLTVNLGFRYEYETPPAERFNRSVRGFDFTSANPIEAQARANYAASPIPEIPANSFRVSGGLTFAGIGNNPRQLWQADRANFAPRAGFALRLPRSTVLRMGYGIFYLSGGVDRYHVNQTGFTQTTVLVPSLDNGQTFVATIDNPFPSVYIAPTGSSGGLATNLGRPVTFFNSERPHGFAQRWSAGVQKLLPRSVLFEASYVGTRGNRLDLTRQWNPVPRQYLSTSPVRDQPVINLLTAQVANPFYPMLAGTDFGGRTVARSQLLRPFPQFNGITSVTQHGYSWYHSLQMRVERRLRGGFTVQGNYTWSKFMEATSYLNPTDEHPEYVISDQDRAQRFVASGIYELPFGRGRRFGAGRRGVTGYLISGWQLSALYQGQSGQPLEFGNVLLYASPAELPLPVGERGVDRWFKTESFERTTGLQLSNNIRGFPSRLTGMRGKGVNIWNASTLRNFRITETMRLQFRVELLNAMNHSHFTTPNTTPTAAAFGTITGTTGFPRQIYFALKLLY